MAGGALVVAVGAGLLRRALHTRAHAHGHHHGHAHGRHHHAHAPAPEGVRRRVELFALGVAGGLVPSPSALVVLLGAVALGRASFGVALVLAYGLGLATTLVSAGLALSRARWLLDRWADRRPGLAPDRLAGVLPLLTAGLVLLGGLVVTLRALSRA